MIQFNLLPDVKLQYLKARRMRRLVTSISIIAVAASLAIMVLLIITVDVFQKKNLSDINSDIKTYSDQLTGTPDLNKILTVQNQLQVLTSLHNQKPVASRLFSYLKQLTPTTAHISQFNIDYAQHTMSIAGSAQSFDVANKFADTLKFATYTKSGSSAKTAAFSNVVLSQYSLSASGATYTITTSFDPAIFDSANDVKLTVPSIISTRSVTEQPTDLFQSGSGSSSSDNGGAAGGQ